MDGKAYEKAELFVYCYCNPAIWHYKSTLANPNLYFGNTKGNWELQKNTCQLEKNRRLRLERNFKKAPPMRNYSNTLKREFLDIISYMQKGLPQYGPIWYSFSFAFFGEISALFHALFQAYVLVNPSLTFLLSDGFFWRIILMRWCRGQNKPFMYDQ